MATCIWLLFYISTCHVYATINITQWTPSPAPVTTPDIWDWHRGFFSAFDNCIYMVGHSDPWKLNLATETWSVINDFSSTSVSLDAQYGTTIDNVFYFQNWDSPNHVYKYDPQNSIWDSTYVAMPNDQGKCFTSNNFDTVYILGSSQQFIKFNISQNPVTLDYGTNIDGAGTYFGQYGYYNGYVYMFGGESQNEIKKYNVGENNEFWNQNSWLTLPVTMQENGLYFGQAILIDHIFYITGFKNPSYSKNVYAFDADTDTFLYAANLNVNRRHGTVAYSLYDDRLYVLIGRDNNGDGLNNYEYSNIVHSAVTNAPTLTPITAYPTSAYPTSAYPTSARPTPTPASTPTIKRLHTVIDGVWYDDFKMIDDVLILGWNMSTPIITDTTYYGPFTETNSSLQDYYIEREFECLHDSQVVLNFTENHCNTGTTDWIDIMFAGFEAQTVLNVGIFSNTDTRLQSFCSAWDGSKKSYTVNNITAGQIFKVLFHIKVTEVITDYVVLYDIAINCALPTTSAPSTSPITVEPTTANPTTSFPTTGAPTTLTPTTLTPTTRTPTTAAPTTSNPSTYFPTTLVPTTQIATTNIPTTNTPTTNTPTTNVPTTFKPTFFYPLSANPTNSVTTEITESSVTVNPTQFVVTTENEGNAEAIDITTTIDDIIVETIVNNQRFESFISYTLIYIVLGILTILCLCLCIFCIVKLRQRKRERLINELKHAQKRTSQIAMSIIGNNKPQSHPNTFMMPNVMRNSTILLPPVASHSVNIPAYNAYNNVMDDINIGSQHNFNTAGNILLMDNESNETDDDKVDDDIINDGITIGGQILIYDESEETETNDDDADLDVVMIAETLGRDDDDFIGNQQIEGTSTDDDDINDGEVIGDHETVLPPPPPPNRMQSQTINDAALDPIVIGNDENDYGETTGD